MLRTIRDFGELRTSIFRENSRSNGVSRERKLTERQSCELEGRKFNHGEIADCDEESLAPADTASFRSA